MSDYSYTEIGMLTGAALSGFLAVLGVIGYSGIGMVVYLVSSALLISTGISLGSCIDRKLATSKKAGGLSEGNTSDNGE